MKYLTEFRDPELAHAVLDEIHRTVTRPWVLMEICGGQTHSIMRYGLDQLLPCLLYTSPSPRDATLSRMPSSA